MRRGQIEWALAPLFLLPLLLGAGFALSLRAEYRRETEPFRIEGRRLAREWLEAGPEDSAWLVRRFEERHAPAPDAGTPFTLDGVSGIVRGVRGGAPWAFTRRFPSGLVPSALADPQVRLAVETGTVPAGAGDVDAGTSALADLLRAPDLDGLRTAPLPPATKSFLLAGWIERGVAPEGSEAAAEIVGAVRKLERVLPGTAGPGVHEAAGLTVLVSAGAWPLQIVSGAFRPEPIPVRENEDGTVRLVWSGRGAWRGRLEEPLAGTYAFVLPFGDRWWLAPAFRRWIGPVVGAGLLLLLLPTALLVSIRRRRRLDEARARFINELAHDLRTPLTSLRLYAEMLAAGKAPEEDRPRYVETMARESGRLSALLANLLDLSRLERGAREFAREPVALDAAAGGALRDFAALHPVRADDVRVAGPDDVSVLADPTALDRVLGNLLDNAGKFTEPGTPVRIAWAAPADGTVRLVVEDEGPGIPAEERARLFGRYERGRRAKADGVPGTGLGLALVRELVHGMGGRVRLAAAEEGCRFEITLPGGSDE